ncbi:MAG: hypothetical protein AAF581_11905 [Planctomycetota bacterium]
MLPFRASIAFVFLLLTSTQLVSPPGIAAQSRYQNRADFVVHLTSTTDLELPQHVLCSANWDVEFTLEDGSFRIRSSSARNGFRIAARGFATTRTIRATQPQLEAGEMIVSLEPYKVENRIRIENMRGEPIAGAELILQSPRYSEYSICGNGRPPRYINTTDQNGNSEWGKITRDWPNLKVNAAGYAERIVSLRHLVHMGGSVTVVLEEAGTLVLTLVDSLGDPMSSYLKTPAKWSYERCPGVVTIEGLPQGENEILVLKGHASFYGMRDEYVRGKFNVNIEPGQTTHYTYACPVEAKSYTVVGSVKKNGELLLGGRILLFQEHRFRLDVPVADDGSFSFETKITGDTWLAYNNDRTKTAASMLLRLGNEPVQFWITTVRCRGSVRNLSGGYYPGATLHFRPTRSGLASYGLGKCETTVPGVFDIELVPGKYNLSIECADPAFVFLPTEVEVRADRPLELTLTGTRKVFLDVRGLPPGREVAGIQLPAYSVWFEPDGGKRMELRVLPGTRDAVHLPLADGKTFIRWRKHEMQVTPPQPGDTLVVDGTELLRKQTKILPPTPEQRRSRW